MPTKEEEEQAKQTRMNVSIIISVLVYIVASVVYGIYCKEDNLEFWPEFMEEMFGGVNFKKNLIPVSAGVGLLPALIVLFLLLQFYV